MLLMCSNVLAGNGQRSKPPGLVESALNESFVPASVTGAEVVATPHGKQATRVMFLEDMVAPSWRSFRARPGRIVRGGHVTAQIDSHLRLSTTVLRSGLLIPGISPVAPSSLLETWDATGAPLGARWHGQRFDSRSPLWALSGTPSTHPVHTALIERGSLTHTQLVYETSRLQMQMERASADADFQPATGALAKKVNAVSPLPRSITALRGGEFTRVGLTWNAGDWQLYGKWREFENIGSVERREWGLVSKQFKFKMGETRITEGTKLPTPVAKEEAKALNAELAGVGKGRSLGTPIAVGNLRSFPQLTEREYVALWQLAEKTQLRREAVEVTGAGGEFSQELTQLTVHGGVLSISRRHEEVQSGTSVAFLKNVGKKALAPLIGRERTVTRFDMRPAPVLGITHTITHERALPGAPKRVPKEQEVKQTMIAFRPGKHTRMRFGFGEAEVTSQSGKTLKRHFSSWDVQHSWLLGRHALTLRRSERRQSVQGKGSTAQATSTLIFKSNPKAPHRVELQVTRMDASPKAPTVQTAAKFSLTSHLSPKASLSARWERQPKLGRAYQSREYTLRVSRSTLLWRWRREPLKGGKLREVSQYQLARSISPGMSLLLNLTTTEQGAVVVRQRAIAIKSKNPKAGERLLRLVLREQNGPKTQVDTYAVTLVQPLSKEVHIGTELIKSRSREGKGAEQQKLYVETTPRSKTGARLHLGYMRLRPWSGEELKAPLVRLSVAPKKGAQIAIGYAVNVDPKMGRMLMREFALQLPLGQAALKLHRFTNMPKGWAGSWTKRLWFSRSFLSPFPQMPTGKKLQLLDWNQLTLEVPFERHWALLTGLEQIQPYRKDMETRDFFVALRKNAGRSEQFELSYRKARDQRGGSRLLSDMYRLAYSRRLSAIHNIVLAAQFNSNDAIRRPGVPEGQYTITLSFTFQW